MKKIAPEDGQIIDEFINGCHNILGVLRASNTEMIKFRRNYNMTVAEFAKRFQNPLLKRYITNMCIPEMPMYSMFMCLGLLASGQLGLLEGGSLNFSNTIARQYKDLGGEITQGVFVKEILVENNTAVGIRLSDGSVHRADVIVSAADGYSTIFQMLGGKYMDQNIRDRYDCSPLLTPLNIVNFGVARQFPNEPSEMIILLKEPLNTGGKDVEEIRLRIFNYDHSFAPSGKTVVQALIYTDFDPTSWSDWSEKGELARKRAHDTILRDVFNRAPDEDYEKPVLICKYLFDWGVVSSSYDIRFWWKSNCR